MDEIAVSTVIYVPREEVYEFLLDFPGYANYSEYLTRVRSEGEGGPGTRYYLTFEWWKLRYTAHSEVTNLDPPERVDWTLVRGIDANGAWIVEEAPEEAPDDRETASRVHFRVRFDADTAAGALDLPRFVSFDWVIARVKPKVLDEAERVVERIVRDLEGEPREVELTVHEGPTEL